MDWIRAQRNGIRTLQTVPDPLPDALNILADCDSLRSLHNQQGPTPVRCEVYGWELAEKKDRLSAEPSTDEDYIDAGIAG